MRKVTLGLTVAIALLAANAHAAPPKKKLPPPIKPPVIQPPPVYEPPQRVHGCGATYSDDVKSPVYRALGTTDEPRAFAWKLSTKETIPADTLIEYRVQFDGFAKVEAAYNTYEMKPEPADSNDRVAISQSVKFGWYQCKVDAKGVIVLTEKDTKEVLRFIPTMDKQKKTVLSLKSEKDGLILKPAKASHPAPSL